MEISTVIIVVLIVEIIALAGVLWVLIKPKKEKDSAEAIFESDVKRGLYALQETIKKIPDATICKVIGRANVERGNFGELVSFLKLKAEYDKIIPFHDIVDFIGIKFPKDDKPGSIDFIDIKTGQARLTKDQVALKTLIKDKSINFIKIKLSIDDCVLNDSEE